MWVHIYSAPKVYIYNIHTYGMDDKYKNAPAILLKTCLDFSYIQHLEQVQQNG